MEVGSQLQKVEAHLDEAYTLKEDFTISKESRDSKIKQLLSSASSELDSISNSITNDSNGTSTNSSKLRAQVTFLQGKVLNISDSYDKNSESLLSKAIRLDPTLAEAWISLGECYWKKGDLSSAKNCFVTALDCKNVSDVTKKTSLRCLSMVLRQLGNENSKEKKQNVEDSVSKAKQAVAMDLSDGYSWYILGNSYMGYFFTNSFDETDLKRALSAYQKAETSTKKVVNPDLHFNRATIYKFKEEFKEALVDYDKCLQLDPISYKDVSQAHIAPILQYIIRTNDFIQSQGRAKRKKIAALIQAMPSTSLNNPVTSQFFRNFFVRDEKDEKWVERIQIKTIHSLHKGENKDSLLAVKIVDFLPKDFLPTTIIVIDADLAMIALSVFNMSRDAVHISDSVIIPNPYLHQLSINYDEKDFNYSSIQTDYRNIIVNDKLPERSQFLTTTFSMEKDSSHLAEAQITSNTKKK